jgi:heme-degrading monooxygenase HmoA
MRFTYLKINPEYQELLPPFYNNIVIPELQKIKGCLFGGLVKSSESSADYVSVTIWNSREQAESYEKGESYQKLMDKVRPYLAESSEWKVHLSEDLELKYDAGVEEPVIREYRVTAQKLPEQEPTPGENPLYVRLVSVKLQKGKLSEFRNLYTKEVVPVLQKTKGCRYIYLTESMQEDDEIISITVWDSKKDADDYEHSGQFDDLIHKVKHTFSHFYQWKMQLEKKEQSKLKTSDDMKVGYYGMVSGKRFD